MRGATDAAIWAYARDHGYTIVSKDNDYCLPITADCSPFTIHGC